MSYLVHAITGLTREDAGPGLRGLPLELIAAGDLGVWASRGPVDTSAPEDAFEHHRIVERICAAQPCLPVRLGTLLPDAEAVRALIASHGEDLARRLGRVGDRRELAVTLLWLDPADRPADDVPAQISATTPGRAFLERKRSDQAVLDSRRTTAERLAAVLATELAIEPSDVRHAVCPSASVALSSAVLAPAGAAEALKERLVRIVSRLDGVKGVVSGPWPPYTFAGTP